jgi:1-aminocyclopropane-1-carboxylate deaminase/D-cysteine desulfhydrase-like pyridoxal-dependent ACC family enzyme
MPRLSERVGRELWIKGDDLTGLALGGNKARKLEYILGRAQASGTDTVVTVGAAQSNHARTVAAAARIMGWDCHLVLGGTRPARPTGNLMLDVAYGAHLHFAGTDDWDVFGLRAREVCEDLRDSGRRPLFIPMGGSTTVGALGFAAWFSGIPAACPRCSPTASASPPGPPLPPCAPRR